MGLLLVVAFAAGDRDPVGEVAGQARDPAGVGVGWDVPAANGGVLAHMDLDEGPRPVLVGERGPVGGDFERPELPWFCRGAQRLRVPRVEGGVLDRVHGCVGVQFEEGEPSVDEGRVVEGPDEDLVERPPTL
ncbi:Uncharacterised protein [Streptococcus pyogenes]|nr:Uncharacterised protein [Streptococcus pyogenes]